METTTCTVTSGTTPMKTRFILLVVSIVALALWSSSTTQEVQVLLARQAVNSTTRSVERKEGVYEYETTSTVMVDKQSWVADASHTTSNRTRDSPLVEPQSSTAAQQQPQLGESIVLGRG